MGRREWLVFLWRSVVFPVDASWIVEAVALQLRTKLFCHKISPVKTVIPTLDYIIFTRHCFAVDGTKQIRVSFQKSCTPSSSTSRSFSALATISSVFNRSLGRCTT